MNLFQRAGRSRLVRSMWALGGTAAAGQVAFLLATPAIARIYPPADFGLFSLILAWAGLTAPAAGGRLEAAVSAARTPREALLLLYAAAGICLWVAPLVGVAVGVSQAFDGAPLVAAVAAGVAVAILVFLAHLGIAVRYWHARAGNYGMLGTVGLQQGLVRAIAPLAFGLVGGSWGGLWTSEVVSRLVGVRKLVGNGLRRRFRAIRRVPRRVYRRLFRDFGEFPRVSVPSVLLDAAAISLPVPLALYFYGSATAGIVGLGMRLTLAPVALVGKAVADVYHAELGHAARGGTDAPRRLFVRLAVGLVVTGLAGFGPLYVWAPTLLPRLLGAEWQGAGSMVQAFVPWGLAAYVVGPLSRSLMVLGGQRLKLIYDVGAVFGVVAAIAGSAAQGAPAGVAMTRMAMVNTLMYGTLFVLLVFKHLRLRKA